MIVNRGPYLNLSPLGVKQSANAIQRADCSLLQLEIPVEAALAAIHLARDAGVRITLNPAPIPSDGSEPANAR